MLSIVHHTIGCELWGADRTKLVQIKIKNQKMKSKNEIGKFKKEAPSRFLHRPLFIESTYDAPHATHISSCCWATAELRIDGESAGEGKRQYKDKQSTSTCE